jgi:phosphoribosyl-dephospho-CoA transferase
MPLTAPGLAPHDLLFLRTGADLVSEAAPAWVAAALARAPLVVVRRAAWVAGLAPVGVRGQTRSERYAAFLAPGGIAGRITPEDLAARRGWRGSRRAEEVGALRALERVEALLGALGLGWGPAGSVGFELASGVPTATAASDLDVVIRAPQRLPLDSGRRLIAALADAPVRVDVQMETPAGAVSLAEYARGGPMVARTAQGPRLVAGPWGEEANILPRYTERES